MLDIPTSSWFHLKSFYCLCIIAVYQDCKLVKINVHSNSYSTSCTTGTTKLTECVMFVHFKLFPMYLHGSFFQWCIPMPPFPDDSVVWSCFNMIVPSIKIYMETTSCTTMGYSNVLHSCYLNHCHDLWLKISYQSGNSDLYHYHLLCQSNQTLQLICGNIAHSESGVTSIACVHLKVLQVNP